MDVSQYLEIFIDETSEHIQSLSDNIMTLEKELHIFRDILKMILEE